MGSLRAKLNLNKREFGILIGTILGDAYVERYDNDARVTIMHSLKQKELVDWKYQEADMKDFPHFMLKEIYEQPKVLRVLAENASQVEDIAEEFISTLS